MGGGWEETEQKSPGNRSIIRHVLSAQRGGKDHAIPADGSTVSCPGKACVPWTCLTSGRLRRGTGGTRGHRTGGGVMCGRREGGGGERRGVCECASCCISSASLAQRLGWDGIWGGTRRVSRALERN